ncbi:lipoprotein, putative [Aliivibrio fischeri MJ11]|uniref:Lipoprotein, putative n=1 Tax=Aliivibrio fischeri (strain MJ11) TaxID=388396 RepID=B5EU67_ALIFM|nr:hypothetical protein [Aliivibrio fischeri]ACH64228.1 lipoprotein, putative [Aliivibrio fischeri MJ11]
MKKLILVVMFTLSLLGCKSTSSENLTYEKIDMSKPPIEIVKALDDLKSSLKDPDSAKFADIFQYWESSVKKPVEENKGYCIRYNAKNSYGGYVGYKWEYKTNYGYKGNSKSMYACDEGVKRLY